MISDSTSPPNALAAQRIVELNTIRILHLSDTFGLLDDEQTIGLPTAEILIHTGNFTKTGSVEELQAFNDWLGKVASRYVYRIILMGDCDQNKDVRRLSGAGTSANTAGTGSDVALASIRKELTNATHVPSLELIDLHGLRILCYPWLHLSPQDRQVGNQWAYAQENIHVLATHAPPLSILDGSAGPQKPGKGIASMSNIVKAVKPQCHLFGHACGFNGYFRLPLFEPPSPSRSESGGAANVIVGFSNCMQNSSCSNNKSSCKEFKQIAYVNSSMCSSNPITANTIIANTGTHGGAKKSHGVKSTASSSIQSQPFSSTDCKGHVVLFQRTVLEQLFTSSHEVTQQTTYAMVGVVDAIPGIF